MGEAIAFDHIHLISRDPKAAADWYREMFGGEVTAVQEDLRGAPQIDVRVGSMTIVIRGQRPGEHPTQTKPIHSFEGYSSHDEWGTDHFGFTYRGDLRAFCAELLIVQWQNGVPETVFPPSAAVAKPVWPAKQ